MAARANTAGAAPSVSGGSGRGFLVTAVLTVLAIGFITVRFFSAASSTLASTRENACRALTPDPIPAALQNVEAPNFELPDAQGRMVSLRAQKGHPVAVNFWATWCPPCREEEPSLRKLASTLDPGKFELVAVSVDDDWDVIDKYFAGVKPPYTVVLDRNAEVSQKYGTTKFPESYLIDDTGKLRLKFVGPRDWTDANVYSLLSALGVAKKS